MLCGGASWLSCWSIYCQDIHWAGTQSWPARMQHHCPLLCLSLLSHNRAELNGSIALNLKWKYTNMRLLPPKWWFRIKLLAILKIATLPSMDSILLWFCQSGTVDWHESSHTWIVYSTIHNHPQLRPAEKSLNIMSPKIRPRTCNIFAGR